MAVEAHPCALCGVKTTKCCGACRWLWCCSVACQLALWPTHQHLCQARRDLFTFPPLDDDEVGVLEWWRKHAHCSPGRFEEATEAIALLLKSGWFKGTWAQLMQSLPDKDSRLEEPGRSLILLCLRTAVFSIESTLSGPEKHKPTAWQQFSSLVYPFLMPIQDLTPGPVLPSEGHPAVHPLVLAQSLLHKVLSLQILSSYSQLQNSKLRNPQNLVNEARVELYSLPLFPLHRDYLDQHLLRFRVLLSMRKEKPSE